MHTNHSFFFLKDESGQYLQVSPVSESSRRKAYRMGSPNADEEVR